MFLFSLTDCCIVVVAATVVQRCCYGCAVVSMVVVVGLVRDRLVSGWMIWFVLPLSVACARWILHVCSSVRVGSSASGLVRSHRSWIWSVNLPSGSVRPSACVSRSVLGWLVRVFDRRNACFRSVSPVVESHFLLPPLPVSHPSFFLYVLFFPFLCDLFCLNNFNSKILNIKSTESTHAFVPGPP